MTPVPNRRRLVLLVGLSPNRSLTLSLEARRRGERVEPVATLQDALRLLAAIAPDEVVVPSETMANLVRPALEGAQRRGFKPEVRVDSGPRTVTPAELLRTGTGGRAG